jgi:hypothetical protein
MGALGLPATRLRNVLLFWGTVNALLHGLSLL